MDEPARFGRAGWTWFGSVAAFVVVIAAWCLTPRAVEQLPPGSSEPTAPAEIEPLIFTAAEPKPEPLAARSFVTNPPPAAERVDARADATRPGGAPHAGWFPKLGSDRLNAMPSETRPGESPAVAPRPAPGSFVWSSPVAGGSFTPAPIGGRSQLRAQSAQPTAASGSRETPVARPVPAIATALAPASGIDTTRARPVAGTGRPMVWANNLNNTQTVDVGLLLGAGRFYDAGYTGGNAHVANIEGGTPWRGHETLNWIPAGNIFWSGSALNESNGSIQDHATATSMNIAGKGSTVKQRGIAYGIPAANFYAGNIASDINSNGSFSWSSNASFRDTYYRAVVQGIGSNNTIDPANRVDVINSSWGGGGTNLSIDTKIIDAIAFEGNQTRGSTLVFSAGNEGPGANTIGAPAVGFNTLAVGALGEFSTDSAGTAVYNVATTFSSRGPIDYVQPQFANSTTGMSFNGIRARVDIAAPGFRMNLANYTGNGSSSTAYATWAGTSFAAPTVAGGIALLADYAWSAEGPADHAFAVDGRVIKAVLINSADKTSGWNNGQSWNGTRWTTTQGLDYTTGGGRMNLDQAFAQYANAAGNTVTQLINPATNTNQVLSTGWARATIDRPDPATAANVDFILTNPLAKNTELNTTLTWFVNRTSAADGSALDVSFHNLNLEVWLTDGSGNPITLVGTSTADHNNTEHLSFLVPESGQYLVRVARPAGADGTYYSFAGDTTSDVFGLAWMARPGLQALADTTTITTGTQSQANVLIAPDAGQTATLAISGNGTRVNVLNRLYVGGTDRGAGGTGTLAVSGGVTVDVSNTLQVFPGGTVLVSDSTLSGGVLAINAGATFRAFGTSTIAFSEIDAAAPIFVADAANVTIRSFRDFNNANSGRLNILSAAASFDVVGSLTVQPVITGSSGLVKNGTGTLILAPTDNARETYTGTTQVNAGALQLNVGNALPNGANVTVESLGAFNIGSQSNTDTTRIGTVTLNGGFFRVPSGNGDYHINKLVMTGGTVNFTGSDGFWLHIGGTGAAITTNASGSTATWIGAGSSRIQNDTTAALPITVANGTADIDLDAGIILSNGGTNANFLKSGSGTMRLTNPSNTANFSVAIGTLRVDDVAALGSGSLTLTGGILAYGSTTADGTTSKPITVAGAANAGFIEVTNAGRTLTLTGTYNYGGVSLVKSGAGTLVLAAATAGGSSTTETQINGGILRVTNNSAIPAGSLVRANSGGTFEIGNGVTVNANINAQFNGTLAGTGAVATDRTITLFGPSTNGAPGGAISPGGNGGTSIGLLTLNGTTGLDVAARSRYVWQVNAIAGSGQGVNWDFVSAGGDLANAAVGGPTTADPFIIDVTASGTVTGFSNQLPATWTIATFAGGIAVPQTAFFANPVGWGDLGGGSFSIAVDGNNLDVVFTPVPVPEPGMVLALAVTALGLSRFAIRPRRKSAVAS